MSALSSQSPARLKAREWVIVLASGHATPQSIAAAKAWLAEAEEHRQAFEAERLLWRDLQMFEKVLAHAQPQHRPARPRQVWKQKKCWAAMLPVMAVVGAVLFFLPDILLHLRADYLTHAGEVATYTLPDGSTLALDAQSAVALHFTKNERRVDLLAGRLWVEVHHGDARPFRVMAADGVTQDVGTAFFVGQDRNRVDIAVTQGHAFVRKLNSAGQTDLQVGQAAHYMYGGQVVRDPSVDPEDVAAWRYGELVIRNQTVAEAIRLVARYRHGPTWVWANTTGMDRVDAVLRSDHPDDAILSLINGRGLKLTHLPGNGLVITSGVP
ncbi:FecR domain-containing protein [Acetobacter sp. LMG 32666]|uniref:FecR family protein n=1 Tax=Acetobacter sp. LMG 32666 TaxID=2959295 RepID=UPI0030C83C71